MSMLSLKNSPPPDTQVKVSISVTAYNHEKYISQAVDSILMQNVNFSYEIIIGEDCSIDNTRNIVLDLQKRYPDTIRLILPQENLGCGGSKVFVRTLQESNGIYIAFLDGDDYWTSAYKLQKQVDFLDSHPECVMCFHNTIVAYEDDEGRGSWNLRPFEQTEILTIEDIFANCCVQTSTIMIRKDTLSTQLNWFNNIELNYIDDWTIAVLSAQFGKIGYINEVMGVYRQHSSGQWSIYDRAQQLISVIDRYERVNGLFNFHYDETIKNQVAIRHYELASEYEKIGDYNSAGISLEKCMAERPKLLEEYLPGVGLTGNRVWSFLKRKLWFYKHPFLYRLSRPVARNVMHFTILIKMFRLLIVNTGHLFFGKGVGIITADPNPIREFSQPGGFGMTTLIWGSLRTKEVEVHIGAPDGPLFSGEGTSGRVLTGEWVHDGMVFYLQDVTEGRPLSSANTLDMVRVTVGSDLMSRLIEWVRKKVMNTIFRLGEQLSRQ
jgi:glycosyltransferase involved in cell wall biosynthesis